MGEHISQADQFAEVRRTEVGILAWLSVAIVPALGSAGAYTEVPSTMHPPMRQAAAVLRSASNPNAARDFLELLESPDSRKLLAAFGVAVPRD